MQSAVFMGVAGCGKSTAAAAVAQRLGWPLVEGDDYHAPSSKEKMRAGIPLTDEDRAGWLAALGDVLAQHQFQGEPVAVTCSALKRRYRDQLRAAAPGVRFVFLEIAPPHALQRVASRAGDHLFPASLVDSQFATLEPPNGEPGVLVVDAMRELNALADDTAAWLRT